MSKHCTNGSGMGLAGLCLVASLACPVWGETLTVTSDNSPFVISADATYDSIVIQSGGELLVTNKVTLNTGTLYVGEGSKGTMTVTDGSTVNVTTAGGEKENAPFKIANGDNSEGHLYLLDGSRLTAKYGLFSKLSHAYSYLTISNAQLVINNSVYNTRNIDSDGQRTNSIFRLQQGGSFTFGRFIRNSPKTTTLFQFDGGVCTNTQQYMASLDGGWLVFEGVNGHPINYAVLGTAKEGTKGYFVLDGSTPSFGTPHVRLTGNGGMRLYSDYNRATATTNGPVPKLSAVTSDYTGDLVITSKRLTLTATNQFFTATNRVVLSGSNGATAVLDLNGFDAECAGIVESNRCYVLNPENCAAATLSVGADGSDSALKTLLCQAPVTVRKVGSGTLSLYSDNGAGHAPALTVEGGAIDLYDRSACGYLIYKWVVTDTYGKNPNQIYMRISEMNLFDANGAKVDLSQTSGENNSALKDGMPSKDGEESTDQFFNRTNFANNAPYFTFTFTKPTPVASYRWATGYDYGTETKYGGLTNKTDVVPPAYDVTMCRDPSDWTVYGSVDGYEWTEIGKVTAFKAPNNRWSWTRSFDLDYNAPLADGKIKVYPGATLNVKSGKRINVTEVENYGTINYADGVTVVLDGAVQALGLLDSGTGSAALEKTGEGEASVLGARPATNAVKVAEGTLRIGGNGGVTQKYWRWRIKDTRDWWYDPEKWAPYNVFPGASNKTDLVAAGELALYDVEGNRVNLLSQGTIVVKADVEGMNDFRYLLDGRFDTYLSLFFEDSGTSEAYINVPRIKPDDPTTWKGFVFKLPDGAKPVYSYDISTPWDHTDRDPTSWDFAVSDDGENWTIIEDHAEEDKLEFLYRLGEPHRRQYGMFNCGLPMRFREGLTVTNMTCYGEDAEVSVAAGATLELPSETTVTGRLRVDATQAADGTVSHLNFAAGGTLAIDNFTRFSENVKLLPLTARALTGVENLATWHLLLDGEPSTKYLLTVANGHLALAKRGFFLIVR